MHKNTLFRGRAAKAEPSALDWLEANTRALERYPGEWLLIHGQRLLLHSRDFEQVQAAIREHRIASPFVYYVPTDEEANFMAI
jgi:Family of unknown function (DUF5678)